MNDLYTDRRQRNLSNRQPLQVNWEAMLAFVVIFGMGLVLGKFVIVPLLEWMRRVL